jgi:hypothetical protein
MVASSPAAGPPTCRPFCPKIVENFAEGVHEEQKHSGHSV